MNPKTAQLIAKALDAIGRYFGTGPAGPMNPQTQRAARRPQSRRTK